MSKINKSDLMADKAKCVVIVGCFDGVHIGHKKIIDSAVNIAKSKGIKTAAFTFTDILPVKSEKNIISCSDKLLFLEESGVDKVYFEDFGQCKSLLAEEFVKNILVDMFDADTVVCGEDFRFGIGASGNAEDLKNLLAKFGRNTLIISPVSLNGQVVSSKCIRKYIKDGEIEKANGMLGRKFSFCLPVSEGAHLGNKIGIPTINQILPENRVCARYGVYISLCEINGKIYDSITDIGVKPTVSYDGQALAETHIFDFDGILYNEEIRVFLIKRIRDEKKFGSTCELKSAIENDIKTVKEYFLYNEDSK